MIIIIIHFVKDTFFSEGLSYYAHELAFLIRFQIFCSFGRFVAPRTSTPSLIEQKQIQFILFD